MIDFKKEKVAVAWCDNGNTDGKFTQGIVHTIIQSYTEGIPLINAIRVQGNQIGRQRDSVVNNWIDQNVSDWLLWVDSDIVLTIDIYKLLLSVADKVTHPIVSGVYFISKDNEGMLSNPMPVIFDDIDKNTIRHIHPLPINEVIKVDCAGMGLVLMHKSVIQKLRSRFPGESLFAEETDADTDKFIGEDIVFFRKVKKAGIQLYAHTGAIAQHMKRYILDYNHYSLWWHDYQRRMEDQSKVSTQE